MIFENLNRKINPHIIHFIIVYILIEILRFQPTLIFDFEKENPFVAIFKLNIDAKTTTKKKEKKHTKNSSRDRRIK